MPKNKTHPVPARFKVTAAARSCARRRQAPQPEKKASKVTRRLTGTVEVAKNDVPRAEEDARPLTGGPRTSEH